MPVPNRCARPAPLRRASRVGAGLVALLVVLAAAGARAQREAVPAAEPGDRTTVTPEGLVNLDFQDVEVATVIDTIARLTGRNFVYDDRVRGRVTIISPTPIPVEQAYTVFESVLQVKGFTTVEAPGGVTKVIPIRDAKETSVDTRAALVAPDTDRFVTRLIPLRYIDAEAIANTLKPLVSKEAALVAYAPTNTLILTDSAANINRVLEILQSIDVETYKEELAMIRVQYADAQTLAEQLSEVFGGEVSSTTGPTPAARIQPRVRRPAQAQQVDTGGAAGRNQVRIITDARTNALIILAARSTLDEMRALIRKLDVPVEGQGRIQVYYLKHADAEEMADTLNTLLGAAPVGGTAATTAAVAAGVQPQQLRSVSEIANLVSSVTADIGTNALVIQASPEGFESLLKVIEKLDIPRPQVLVEALIMEVTVNDSRNLGLDWVVRVAGPDTGLAIQQGVAATGIGALLGKNDKGDTIAFPANAATSSPFSVNLGIVDGDNVIQAIMTAAATDGDTNIISAPHILTSDNEEAEILVGNNIPIITSRVQSAAGIDAVSEDTSLATSQNVERQDIGVTLRVTPQITEGDRLRLEIFQEITDTTQSVSGVAFDPNTVGPALTNRRVENVVVVEDGATVVIGGLVSDDYEDTVTKVPWLGDIPVLGWLFKNTRTNLVKQNLLVFLTPHVIRTQADLERASIGKREEFRARSQQGLGDREPPERPLVTSPVGLLGEMEQRGDEGPAASVIDVLERRYPLERMREIEREQEQRREQERAAEAARARGARYVVLAGNYADPEDARGTLLELVDAGFDGALVSSGPAGRVRYELRVGPYQELEQAERAAMTLQRAYGLSSQIVLERPPEGP